MFNACRIPHRGMDGYKIHDPSRHRHCIVARKGKFFTFNFVDQEGNPKSIQELESNLTECIQLADQGPDSGLYFGWLTSSDRDAWADARAEMIEKGGPNMVKALHTLESGALLLCLDDEKPISRSECAKIFWTGDHTSGHNRWFDKSIQLMVTENGKAGLIGEHSMMDGMPMIAFANSITEVPYIEKVSANPITEVFEAKVKRVFHECEPFDSTAYAGLSAILKKAQADYTILISDHDLHVLSFQRYGNNQIKSMGYSPE